MTTERAAKPRTASRPWRRSAGRAVKVVSVCGPGGRSVFMRCGGRLGGWSRHSHVSDGVNDRSGPEAEAHGGALGVRFQATRSTRAKSAMGGGFNRSMQHTNHRVGRRSVADEATATNLLFRQPSVSDPIELMEGRSTADKPRDRPADRPKAMSSCPSAMSSSRSAIHWLPSGIHSASTAIDSTLAAMNVR